MKTSNVILIIILLGVIGFVIYYITKSKKEDKQASQTAAGIANTEAILTANEIFMGVDLSDNVRKFGQ